MKINISQATLPQLNYLVAVCEKRTVTHTLGGAIWVKGRHEHGHELEGFDSIFNPASSWAWGGPIIEDQEIALNPGYSWEATVEFKYRGNTDYCIQHGPTPLIAAMKVYVVAKLGFDVEVPEELL